MVLMEMGMEMVAFVQRGVLLNLVIRSCHVESLGHIRVRDGDRVRRLQ